MDRSMVNFPSGLAYGWEDSGEGGLFVMLVVAKPVDKEGNDDREAWDTFCHVDVPITMHRVVGRPGLRLPSPDVCVSAERVHLWEPYNHEDNGFRRMVDVAEIVKSAERPELMQWVYGARSHLDESVELLAAAHLGSTSHSLWNVEGGHYFDVQYDDLNERGRAMYDAFQAAYGITPLLLTFLDT